jgi:hypothetical protein
VLHFKLDISQQFPPTMLESQSVLDDHQVAP